MFILVLLFLVMHPLSSTGQDPLQGILNEHPEKFGHVLRDQELFQVQIIYTQIDRDQKNRPVFRDYSFGLDRGKYFYPASTVKLPVAAMAMEKVNKLNIADFDCNNPMLTDSAYEGQTSAYHDSTSWNGLPYIAHYIEKILLASDNDAYNRLYEFLGQSTIYDRLVELRYPETRIIHRLSIPLSPELNRYTNPVRFYHGEKLVYHQPLVYNRQIIKPDDPVKLGKGYMNGEVMVYEPMDFTYKNSMPLEDLHAILKSIIFPEDVPVASRFALKEKDYKFFYKFMSMYPRESGIPGYDKYEDGYCKFFLFGGEGQSQHPGLRIFNKVGIAYGFLTETAFIVDFEKNIEFMLSATMYVNKNDIFMDDEYEYNETGFPFFRDLGLAVYEYEEQRIRTHDPDLSRYIMKYK